MLQLAIACLHEYEMEYDGETVKGIGMHANSVRAFSSIGMLMTRPRFLRLMFCAMNTGLMLMVLQRQLHGQ